MTGSAFQRISFLVFFAFSICLFFSSPVPDCSAKTSTAYQLKQADNSRKSLYQSAKRMDFRHNWMNTISQYEKIYKKYPESNEAPWAMFRAAGM